MNPSAIHFSKSFNKNVEIVIQNGWFGAVLIEKGQSQPRHDSIPEFDPFGGARRDAPKARSPGRYQNRSNRSI